MRSNVSSPRRLQGLVAGAALLAFSSVGWAQLSPYSEDFEGLGVADPGALSGAGWLAFGSVFDGGGGFKFGYGPFGAPNGGPGFSAIATGEGGASQGAQQLVAYNDYNCCGAGTTDEGHFNGTDLVESNIFQEQTIGPGDIGSVWSFSFDAKRGDIGGATTAVAFIKTLDPNAGFSLTNFLTVDATALDTNWQRYEIVISLADGALDGQILQIGFASTASNFDPSGNFYDNIDFSQVAAEDLTYDYEGTATKCLGTCDSFASLGGPGGAMNETPSELSGSVEINAAPGGAFGFGDVNPDINFEVFNSNAPAEAAIFAPDADPRCDGLDPGTICNGTTANPLPLNSAVAALREENLNQGTSTGGVIDTNGDFISGTLLLEFIVPPFSNNSAWAVLDVGTGVVQVCIFYDTSGCNPLFSETSVFEGAWTQVISAPDTDGDGVTDDVDNCTLTANASQTDTDGDNIGNACDADIFPPGGGDCSVNFGDLSVLKAGFFPVNDPLADFNGDGGVNFGDLAFMKATFFNGGDPGPGPGAPGNACE